MPPGGGGGTKGTFSGDMIFSAIGDTGVGLPGRIGGTGPGGGGVGPFAVLLAEPGRTAVSESLMLGLVFESWPLESAKDLYAFPSVSKWSIALKVITW